MIRLASVDLKLFAFCFFRSAILFEYGGFCR